MKAKSLLFAAVAIMMAACNTDQPADEFVASFGVTGVKDNAVSVTADAKDVTVTVTANLSWSASCDADWISVDPASYNAADKEEASVKVKISIAANDTEAAREAKVSFGAEGVTAIAITVKQEGKAHEYKTVEVFDVDKFEAIANYSISAEGMGGAVSFVINANTDWTATCPEWIALDPATNKYDGENDLVTVSASIAANETGAAREGQITIKGTDCEKDLVIAVSQGVPTALGLNVVSYSYRNAFVSVDVPDETWWTLVYANDSIFGSYGTDGLAEYLVSYIQRYVTNYASSYTAEQLFEILCEQGPASSYEVKDLDGETKYHVVAVGLACADGETVTMATLPGHVEFTTPAVPQADAAYTAVLGTYEVAAYDYFDSKSAGEDVYNTLTMEVSALDINETVAISFTDGNYFPQGSNGSVDTFVGTFDKANGCIKVANEQLSTDGYQWNYGTLGTCGIALDFYYWESEEVTPEYGILTWDEGNTTLTVSADLESDVEEDYIYIMSGIISETDGDTGSCNAIALLVDPTFEKAEAAAEAASVKPAVKGVKGINFAKKYNVAK